MFWTGIPRQWAQSWADEMNLYTQTTMMGPLMERDSQRCLKRYKSPKQWKRYVSGAAGLFADLRKWHHQSINEAPSWYEKLASIFNVRQD